MALSPGALLKGIVQRFLPSPPTLDGPEAERAVRMGRYGDMKVESCWPTKHLLSDEGAYMVASVAPGAAAIQLGLSAAFSAAAAAFVFQNSDNANGKRMYMDFLRFTCSTAPTSATQWRAAMVIDSASRVPTTISNATGANQGPGTPATATAYRSPVFCTNMDATPNIIGIPFFPLSTAAGAPPAIPGAGPNARTIFGQMMLRSQIPVAGDEYVLTFGNADPGTSLVTAAPAGASRIVVPAPPVIIGPGHFAILYLWGPSNATAGFAMDDVCAGWVEK